MSSALTPGSRFGPYEIQSPLGAGGMGEVFLARDTRLERRVALKVLRPTIAADADRIRRFMQEARAASALTHPHVAVIYDVGESNGIPFIAMEYVEGHTLADVLQGEPLATHAILKIAVQIADALQAAHAGGVVHRDVKPANLMITAQQVVKVLDFGLAKLAQTPSGSADGEDTRSLPRTEPGIVMGTVAYMSPEQAIGAPVDHRTDLFSLGVVLYQAATGRLPFAGSTDIGTIDQIRHAAPDAIARFNYAIPSDLERIIRRCLEKDPERRYQNARDLLIDLQSVARDSSASGAASGERSRGRHNLPEEMTSFIGRQQEVQHVSALVGASRLVTLTGAGGSGKTRLAQRLGINLARDFADGAWFVDLAPLTDPELLPNGVARVLLVPEGRASLVDAIIEWLRSRQLLLILDNCEHLIDACAGLAETLLGGAPHVRILATSREALGVRGETVWRVPSLAVPQNPRSLEPADVLNSDAVRLFVERASAAAPFTLTPENATAVVEICRRLDGIPLAIELAAARVNVLAPEQISARLQDRFRLLTGGGRTAVARQRTLEATVDWSYELLAEPERRLLARLSVFSGGWTLEGAERVGSGDGIEPHEVLDLLSRLVNKSLVTVEEHTGAERRYRFLETLRQYGRERLLRSGEVAGVSARHFDFYLNLALRAEPSLIGRDQLIWLDRVESEHDNLRGAIEWAVASPDRKDDALRLAAALWWFWTKRGYFSEGAQRLEEALAVSTDTAPEVETRALVGLMHLVSFQGDVPGTEAVTARALAAARRTGDPWAEAFALGGAAILASDRGDFPASTLLARQARALAQSSGHPIAHQPLALAVRMLAYAALQEGDLQQAGILFEESIGLLRAAQEAWSLGILLSDLAALRVLEGRHAEAGALAREALGFCRSLGDRRGIGWCLQTIAMVEASEGQASRAASLYGAAEALLESTGATGQVTVTRVQDRYLGLAMEALGEPAYRKAVAAGRALSLQRALDAAFHQRS